MSHSKTIWDVHQATAGKYSVQLVDQDDAALDSTVLETLTLTLYDTKTLTIINSRHTQNVLNANQVAIDCEGLLVWHWVALDMPMISTTKDEEIHTALFTFVWGSGAYKAYHEVSFRVHRMVVP